MRPLDIWFETLREPQTFAHIKSADGLLGHAQEIRERIPVGTWLNIQPALQPTVTPWLIAKAGFCYMGAMIVDGEVHDILQRVD